MFFSYCNRCYDDEDDDDDDDDHDHDYTVPNPLIAYGALQGNIIKEKRDKIKQ